MNEYIIMDGFNVIFSKTFIDPHLIIQTLKYLRDNKICPSHGYYILVNLDTGEHNPFTLSSIDSIISRFIYE